MLDYKNNNKNNSLEESKQQTGNELASCQRSDQVGGETNPKTSEKGHPKLESARRT